MTVREVYNFLQTNYPPEARRLISLAWPVDQDHCGVQFIDEHGQRIGGCEDDPVTFLLPEPLAGPFYVLQVVGICPVILYGDRFRAWKNLRLVVKRDADDIRRLGELDARRRERLPDGMRFGDETSDHTLTLSSFFQLRVKMSELKDLAPKLGISWYHTNFDWPVTYTRLNNFDEWKVHESSNNHEGRV